MDVIVQNVNVEHKYICPVIDAKREMIYACIYEYFPDNQLHFRTSTKSNLSTHLAKDRPLSVNLWKRVSELLIISPDEIINILPEGTLVFGDGVSRYVKIFEKGNLLTGNNDTGTPEAHIAAILGRHAYERGKQCDINHLKPIYLQNLKQQKDYRQEKIGSKS
jgi:tRNA threonylcarbamoyladenosine biosynthesis protein TsaB